MNGFQATPGFLLVFGFKNASGKLAIDTTFQQLITSLLQVGLILASVILGPFSNHFGRKQGFIFASLLAYVGITIQILVTSQWPIYIGRLVMGLSNGLFMYFLVLYITECSTAAMRGSLVTLFQPFTSLGTFIGAVVSNALHTNTHKISYQAQLVTLYLVPTWTIFISFYVPESPRWLLLNGRREHAIQSVLTLRDSSLSRDSAELEVRLIEEYVAREREISRDAWRELFRVKDIRRTFLTISCATFHAASGINFIIGYSTFFYQQAGVASPFIGNVITQLIGCAAAFSAIYLAGAFRRRSLLLTGFLISSICMFAVAILYTVAPGSRESGKALVALLAIYQGAYGATIGPLSWVMAGELPCTRLRSLTFGISMAVGAFFAWLTTFTTPYFINPRDLNLGGKVAWIWAPSNLITLVFIYFALPETEGLTLEEVDKLFYRLDISIDQTNSTDINKSDDFSMENSKEGGETNLTELV